MTRIDALAPDALAIPLNRTEAAMRDGDGLHDDPAAADGGAAERWIERVAERVPVPAAERGGDQGDDFATLFTFLPIGAYRSTPDGRQLRANPALVRLNGFSSEAEQLAAAAGIFRDWYVQPDRRDEFLALLERDNRVTGFESEVWRHRTGERIWVSENAHLVRDALGRPRYYEGTVEEITARVREREALALSRQHLQQTIDLVPGVLYRLVGRRDRDMRVAFVSPSVQAVLGLSQAEALAGPGALRRLRHPDDRERVAATFDAADAAGAAVEIEFRVILDDGRERWVQQTSSAGPPEDGLPVRVGLIRDITERKQAELAYKQAQALRWERDHAAAADRAKSQFLSRVSHELRTPLNAILGFAQLLQLERDLGERQRSWVQQVLDSGRHLLALVNDVLDLSSVQTGQLPLTPETCPLQPVVAQACEMLAAAAEAAGVRVDNRVAADPALVAWADGRRLTQIVCNLLSNAIKYNHPGGWVRLDAQRKDDVIELAVADGGPGIAPEQMARLFNPFERLQAGRGPVAGTGLGLALSREFAQAMGGALGASSKPGEGSTFYLRLPCP